MIREGTTWRVTFDGEAVYVRDSKGLRYLAVLLAHPGRRVPALDVCAAAEQETLSGPPPAGALDDTDRSLFYDLCEELDYARACNDVGRAGSVARELERLSRRLYAQAGSPGAGKAAEELRERARKRVGNAIRRVIERLGRFDRPLAEHLSHTVRTGTFCVYQPDPRSNIAWHVDFSGERDSPGL